MGVEAEHYNPAGIAYLLTGLFDKHLVPEVNAVVVADGQGGPVGPVG